MKFVCLALCLMSFNALAANQIVEMKSLSYSPKVLTIKPGDTVEWKNTSLTEHSATFEAGGYETGRIQPKKTSKKIKFADAGTFPYHCSVHGKTMSAQIIVQP